MFSRSRKDEPAKGNPRIADGNTEATEETAAQHAQRLGEWRRSAQRVIRAWNAWLAAERRDRAVRYLAFIAALADEERAAMEIQRVIALRPAGLCVTAGDPGLAHGEHRT